MWPILLCMAFLLVIPTLAGSLVYKILNKNITCISGAFALGSFWVLLFAFGVHFLGAFLRISLRNMSLLFLGLTLLTPLVLGLIYIIRRRKKSKQYSGKEGKADREALAGPLPYLALICMLALSFVNLYIYEPIPLEDDSFTIERTLSLLQSGSAYSVYPTTGQELTYGVSFLGKLNFIPSFYAMLLNLFHITGRSAFPFLTGILPFYILLLHLSLVYLLIRSALQLFRFILGEGSEKRRDSFLTLLSLPSLSLYGILIYMSFLLTCDLRGCYAFSLVHMGYVIPVVLLSIGVPLCIVMILHIAYYLILSGRSKADIKPPVYNRLSSDGEKSPYPPHRIGLLIFGLCLAVSVAGTAFPGLKREDLVRNVRDAYEPRQEGLSALVGILNAMERSGEIPYVVAPSQLLYSLRYYDYRAVTLYGRDIVDASFLSDYHDDYEAEAILLCQYMEAGADSEAILELAMSLGVNVLVTPQLLSEEAAASHGLTLANEAYHIYTR